MLILFVSVSAYGQGLQGTDLSRVKATDISDAQLKSFIERGEKEGISPTEAMEMARARGMSASVANELLQRAEQLMARQESENAAVSALRTNGEPLAPFKPAHLKTVFPPYQKKKVLKYSENPFLQRNTRVLSPP